MARIGLPPISWQNFRMFRFRLPPLPPSLSQGDPAGAADSMGEDFDWSSAFLPMRQTNKPPVETRRAASPSFVDGEPFFPPSRPAMLLQAHRVRRARRTFGLQNKIRIVCRSGDCSISDLFPFFFDAIGSVPSGIAIITDKSPRTGQTQAPRWLQDPPPPSFSPLSLQERTIAFGWARPSCA